MQNLVCRQNGVYLRVCLTLSPTVIVWPRTETLRNKKVLLFYSTNLCLSSIVSVAKQTVPFFGKLTHLFSKYLVEHNFLNIVFKNSMLNFSFCNFLCTKKLYDWVLFARCAHFYLNEYYRNSLSSVYSVLFCGVSDFTMGELLTICILAITKQLHDKL